MNDISAKVREAQDLIETVAAENADRLKKAEDNLTAVVSDAFLGKEVVLVDVANDTERSKAPKAYTVEQVTGLFVLFKNRNGRPVSKHFTEVKLA